MRGVDPPRDFEKAIFLKTSREKAKKRHQKPEKLPLFLNFLVRRLHLESKHAETNIDNRLVHRSPIRMYTHVP